MFRQLRTYAGEALLRAGRLESRFQINENRILLYSARILPAIYVAVLFSAASLPFLDIPNHLTRAYIIQHLSHDNYLQKEFLFSFHFIPYIFADLALSVLTGLFAVKFAGLLWLSILFLGFVLGALLLARFELPNDKPLPIVVLISTYLATSWFFVSGFHAYCLSLGIAFLTIAAWLHFVQPGRDAAAKYALYSLLVVICYLSHLAGFFYAGLIIGVRACYRMITREIEWMQFTATLFPLATVSVIHIWGQHFGAKAEDQWVFRSALNKLLALSSMSIRYDFSFDIGMLGIFAAVLAWMLWLSLKTIRQVKRELLLVTVALFAVYLILPRDLAPAFDIDNRTLPIFSLYLTLTLLAALPAGSYSSRALTAGCLALSTLNLVYVTYYWHADDRFLGGLEQAVLVVPPNQRLLTIYTRPIRGRVDVGAHHALLYAVYRDGTVPNIFSENNSPDEFEYFRYRRKVFLPNPFWYVWKLDRWLDWQQAAQDYDLILITRPADRARLHLDLEEVYANDAAVLYRIKK